MASTKPMVFGPWGVRAQDPAYGDTDIGHRSIVSSRHGSKQGCGYDAQFLKFSAATIQLGDYGVPVHVANIASKRPLSKLDYARLDRGSGLAGAMGKPFSINESGRELAVG
jgi:hypothetical protein